MSTQGDIRKVVRKAIRRGWRDVSKARRRASHIQLEWTDGTRVTASSTPSCYRAMKNFMADISRTERRQFATACFYGDEVKN
jgi:hypothetical protein